MERNKNCRNRLKCEKKSKELTCSSVYVTYLSFISAHLLEELYGVDAIRIIIRTRLWILALKQIKKKRKSSLFSLVLKLCYNVVDMLTSRCNYVSTYFWKHSR